MNLRPSLPTTKFLTNKTATRPFPPSRILSIVPLSLRSASTLTPSNNPPSRSISTSRPLPSHLPPRSIVLLPRTAISHRSTTARNMATKSFQAVPVFSSSYDPVVGERELASLLKGAETEQGKWKLISSGMGVERSFRFKTFKKTWEFMNVVAAECAVKKHHPEWSNVYNTTFIRWTTHSPPGLSEKDILMARFCDAQALLFGEVKVEVESARESIPASASSEGNAGANEKAEPDVGKELADRVAREGGECCVPKSLRTTKQSEL